MVSRTTVVHLLFVVCLIPAFVPQLEADEEGKIPPGREAYMGRRIARTMSAAGAGWLTRKIRQEEEDCAALLKNLNLKPGMVVCDMGCGNGFYSLKMAELVGEEGTVLGVDIQSEMLRLLQARAEEQGIENVKRILGTVADPKLPKGTVDLILCVDVYHEFSHPELMLKAMRESLAPGGVIALAEYREEDPSVPIKPLHKMSKKQVLREYNANGFKLVREFDGLPWQHLMYFGKDDDKSSTSASSSSANLSKAGNGDHVVGPEYRTDPDLTDRGNPKGKRFEFTMPLADSKIFRGDDETLDPRKPVRKERKIFVYVPAAYEDGTEAPILVMHDGPSRLSLVQNALDNLTISNDPERRLPPFIAISVQNGGNDSKGSQRGLEYDTMSDRFARFINDEVLPAVLANKEIRGAYPKISFTADPWGRATMGCSSGGAAALTMGWFRPDLFRRIITYSGTFVDQQDDDAPEEAKYKRGAWEYHSEMKLIENSEKKPLRIFTHVAEFDNGAGRTTGYHNWVEANKRTAAALAAKGYDYRYVFSRKSRHCDKRVFEYTLADTLVWMWRGYGKGESN